MRNSKNQRLKKSGALLLFSFFECAPPHALPYEDVTKANTRCEPRAQRGGQDGGWDGADSYRLGRRWKAVGWKGLGGRGFIESYCMTCGTHTTANVTAATFGFNPLLSGSFLEKARQLWMYDMQPFFFFSPKKENITPAVSSRHATHRLSSRSFHSTSRFGFWRASRPLCEHAGHAGPGAPLGFLFGERGSLLPYFVTSWTSPISFIFQARGYCQYAQLPPCVSVYVCACVSVYIYEKERIIFMNLFFPILWREILIRNKKKQSPFLFFFFLSGTLPYYLEGKCLFSWNLDYE